MHLLLVEDESAIATALRRSLRRWGHTVGLADCCEAARQEASRQAPEALLSDLKLPDGQGTDLAAELGLPFILMSGYGQFDDAVTALRLGCVDFLTKPVALGDLKVSLDRLAERAASWDLCVVDTSAEPPQLGRPTAGEIQPQVFASRTWDWQDPAEAARCWQGAQAECEHVAERRLLAELLQAAPSGRLVLNRGPNWWRAWLQGAFDWGDPAQADRRQVVESVAQRCFLRENGLLVEWAHVGS